MLFLIIGAASAYEDSASDNSTVMDDKDVLSESLPVNDVLADNSSAGDENASDDEVIKNATFAEVSKQNYLIGDTFQVSLLDDNKTGIANQSVYFTLNGVTTKALTDAEGTAILNLTISKGVYTVYYSFNETGYNPASGSKKILLLKNPVSTIKASNMNAYAGLKKTFKITLKADGIPLAGRTVKVVFNKKTYYKKTDSNGQVKCTIYVKKGKYTIKYYFTKEENINASSGKAKITVKLYKNKFKTKYRTVWIDADGGFTKAFLKDVAKRLRMAGWKVIVKGIGPDQHSKNYKKVRNAVYMPFYNGMCAATIEEMGKSYYGGVIKSHKSVLAPAWYSAAWEVKVGVRTHDDITKVKFLKRAWDDDFSPKSYKGLKNPAQYMTNHGIKYCVSDTTYKIVEQFIKGGWVAAKK